LANPLPSCNISSYLHREGINLRYIGLVLDAVDRLVLEETPDIESGKRNVYALLGIEAVARVVKNHLNEELRKKMKELKLPLEVFGRNLFFSFPH
jgi:hypothetical protein